MGKQTGAVEQYAISGSYGTLVDQLGLQASGLDVAAADATATISGVAVTSGTNTFTNAISGVSLTAVSVGAGATLTVGSDNSPAIAAVKDMLTKYNDIINQIKTDTKYDTASKTGGPLSSDNFVKGLTAQLNRMVSDPFGSGVQNGGLLNFSDAGITIARDGTLTLNESKLTSQLATNPAEVMALFNREDGAVDLVDPTVKLNQGANGAAMGDGIANRLRAFSNALTSATSDWNPSDGGGLRFRGGLLARMDGIQSRIDTLGDRVDAFELRLAKRESTLRNQFTAMEKAITLIRSQGSYLTSQQSQQ
jgi:flagellar hook-associated protein 2